MRGYLVCTLILSAMVYSESVVLKPSNICDTCRCLPSASAEKAKNIQCTCDSTIRNITTTIENMKELPHLESFTVVNCDSVRFQKASFGNKHDLSSVILKGVKKAIFPLGVFAKLESLKIEDVEDLELMANAFLGAQIGEIAIRNSTIREIPEFALYDVSLQKLELSDVKIGVIKSNSTMFVMGEQSHLNMDRCKVDRVEAEGLRMRAQNLRISGCTLNNLAPSSTLIDAAIGIDILATTFGKSDSAGMHISSKSINIFNNTFLSIPIVLAPEGGRVQIKNNFIQELEINNNVFNILKAEFIRNTFLCSCQFAEILKGAEDSASLYLPNFQGILANNYCQSNCASMVSVKDMLDQVKAKQTCDPADLTRCPTDAEGADQEAQDFTTLPGPGVSGRSGRQDDHDDHHDEHHADPHQGNHSTEGPRTTSGHTKHGAHFILSMVFLATLLVVT